jgi:hypothetical protein
VANMRTRRTQRVILLSVCGLVLAGLFAAVVRQSLVTNADARRIVVTEGHGAELLHKMASVLTELVAAQSAAVRGQAVNATAVGNAFDGMQDVDKDHGVELGTHDRLVDLRSKVENALGHPETGRAAFDTYSDLVTLAVDLMKQIGDRSNLIHDPDLDSYYLMDAAIIRLPEAVTLAGRASDLVALANDRPLEGEDAVRAAVARFLVSDAAEQVSTGLTLSVASTSRAELGGNIAAALDAFKDAAGAFSPPTMLAELSSTVDASTLAANARRVSAAAAPLVHRLLTEGQGLLDARNRRLVSDLRFTLVTTVLGGLVALVLLYLLISAGFRPLGRYTAELGTGDITGDIMGRAAVPPPGGLGYARHRLDGEDLVSAGRPARRPGEVGDAQ